MHKLSAAAAAFVALGIQVACCADATTVNGAQPVSASPAIGGFRFLGNTALSDESLSEALSSYLDEPLAAARLTEIAQQVRQQYEALGHLALVAAPAGAVGRGVVTLVIEEVRLAPPPKPATEEATPSQTEGGAADGTGEGASEGTPRQPAEGGAETETGVQAMQPTDGATPAERPIADGKGGQPPREEGAKPTPEETRPETAPQPDAELGAAGEVGGEGAGQEVSGEGAGKEAPSETPAVESRPAAAETKPETVTGFRLLGNTALPDETLQAPLAPYVGKPLDPEKLPEMQGLVQDQYLQQGYLAAVSISPENISQGVVTVQVIESTVGEITFEGNERYSEPFLNRYVRGLVGQKPLRLGDLEGALQRMNDNPGLEAKASLAAGKEPGTTDIAVAVVEEKAAKPTVTLDTFGSASVSRERITEEITFDNPRKAGDSLTLRMTHAPDPNDLLYGQLHYVVPLNAKGRRLSLSHAQGDFQAGQEFAVLDMKGKGRWTGLSLTQPLAKSKTKEIVAELGIEAKDTELALLGQTTSRDRIRSARLGLSYQTLTPGKALGFASVQVHRGLGESLGGMSVGDPLASRPGGSNDFMKTTVYAAYLRSLGKESALALKGSAQFTGDSLVAGEQWAAGGFDSVRGYPPSELLGDKGYQASLELQLDLIPPKEAGFLKGLKGCVFLDYGYVQDNSPLPGQPRSREIWGTGIGLEAELQKGLKLSAQFGYALSGEPSTGGRLQSYIQASAPLN